jgi:hypothetical protein
MICVSPGRFKRVVLQRALQQRPLYWQTLPVLKPLKDCLLKNISKVLLDYKIYKKWGFVKQKIVQTIVYNKKGILFSKTAVTVIITSKIFVLLLYKMEIMVGA